MVSPAVKMMPAIGWLLIIDSVARASSGAAPSVILSEMKLGWLSRNEGDKL